MKNKLEKLSLGFSLDEKESYDLITDISEEKLNATQISAALAFYISRPITNEELSGFKNALLDLSIPVKLDKQGIDVCGTGGDGKNTFNISTLSALVLAATGIPIAKHGNYASSSVSGSSDVLKHLGYQFKTTSSELNADLNNYNFCFMHAPLFHPALKKVATIRKEMGVRTFFNIMGPLVNPANISGRYVGVFNLETARLYNYHLQKEKLNYTIVHSTEGYDEVSLTSPFKLYSNQKEQLIQPEDIGFKTIKGSSIMSGNTISDAGDLFLSVLKNECTREQKDVVVINSALAYLCYKPEIILEEAINYCKEAIESKKAFDLLKKLINN